MGNTLAETVQLQRAEEQANGARVRWEFRTLERRVEQAGLPMRVVSVRMPDAMYEALARHGPPTVVARRILKAWLLKVAR